MAKHTSFSNIERSVFNNKGTNDVSSLWLMLKIAALILYGEFEFR
jgi:hypothetical protein